MLSKEFILMLDKMNIRVYNLSTGDQIIGQLDEAHEFSIELKNVLELIRINLNDSFITMMIPYVPFNDSEPAIVYRSSIVFESAASLLLKKKYCDSLLLNKLSEINDQEESSSNELDNLDDVEEDNFNWNYNSYRNWNN